jgi:SET and MYND domain-containing protein
MASIGNVQVQQSAISGAGRGLFALKDFQPGDVVLSVERPLVAELDIDRLRDSCAWCFQRSATDPMERAHSASMGLPTGFTEVKACTGCRRISYCSKKCQSKAWKFEHKYECKILTPKERPDLPEAVRAVIKLLGRLKAEGNKDERLSDILNFRPFAGGQGLEEFSRQNKKLFDDFSMLGFAAWKYTGEPKLDGVDSQNVAKAFLFNVRAQLSRGPS